MKIKVHYYNRNFDLVEAVLSPTRIKRAPCGQAGAARECYRYYGYFPAPKDAHPSAVLKNGLIYTEINRHINPKFTPKGLEWDSNIATLEKAAA